HRAERAPAGRASGDGARDVDGSRAPAGPDSGRRAASAWRAGAAQRPRDRNAHQRGGPARGLPPGAGPSDAFPPAAGPGCARRYVRRGGLDDPAVLRLDDREGDRARLHPRARDRARTPGAGGARDRRRADDAGGDPRDPRQRPVPQRRVLDVVPRRGRAGGGRMKVLAPGVRVTEGALTRIVVRAVEAVDGARVRRPRRKVDVEIEDGRAKVDLELAVAYGRVLPEVARAVQR